MISRREIRAMKRTASTLGLEETAVPTMPSSIIEFATSEHYLALRLYPAQATLLKIWNLRDDLFTGFCRDLVGDWEAGFTLGEDEHGPVYRGTRGIAPDLADRVAWCKANDLPWFSEIVTVVGRRGGKNYLVAIQVLWAMWRMLCMDDPHERHELPRDKTIGFYFVGANFDQAMRNGFRDIENLILGASCFEPFIGRANGKAITVLTPAQLRRGARPKVDQGALQIVPAATTPNAARGPAVAVLVMDELGHLERGTSSADSIEIYRGASPSLGQFPDRLIIQISSPWLEQGQLYRSHQESLRVDADTGAAKHPSMFSLQLPSPDMYVGAERSAELEGWPGGPSLGPPMKPKIDWAFVEAEAARDLEAAKVEFEAQYGTIGDTYLTGADVDSVFARYQGTFLTQQSRGILNGYYVAHADPSRTGDNFGFAIAHVEVDDDDVPHVIFDVLHVWRPRDFPGHKINYMEVRAQIFRYICDMGIDQMSFDPWNSAGEIDNLEDMTRRASLPKPTRFRVTKNTKAENWKMFEIFKSAVRQGIVHAPTHDLARDELRSLIRGNERVDHPTSGPVKTKDLVDAMVACTYYVLDEKYQVLFERLAKVQLRASQSATPPIVITSAGTPTPHQALSDIGRRIARRADGTNPARPHWQRRGR